MSECFAVALGAIGFGLLAFKAGVLLVACALENGPKPTLTDAEKDAADEIERLLIGGGMRQTDAEYRDEIASLRLTDAEREAVRYMIAAGKFGQRDEELTEEHAAALRGLLERLGGGA